MIVNINFALILIISYIFGQRHQTKKIKKYYLFVCNSILGITAAYRYTPYYTDYLNYDAGMTNIRNSSIEQIVKEFLLGNSDALFRKVLSLISEDNQIYFIVSAIFLAIAISLFIYRRSSNIYISEIAYVSLCFYSLSLNIIRQFIAISICILAYQFLEERRFWRYLIFIIMAMSFHPSAAVMLPAYFLTNIPVYEQGIKELVKICLFSVIGYIFIRVGLDNQYVGYNEDISNVVYGSDSANILGIIVPIFIILVLYIVRNWVICNNIINKYRINMAYMSLVYYVLSVTGALIIQRMALYFSIYTVISISEIGESGAIRKGKAWIVGALICYYVVWALLGKVNIITQFRF